MQKCAKMANFGTYGLNYWETVEDIWVHAAMRLTSNEFMQQLETNQVNMTIVMTRDIMAKGWLAQSRP